MTSGAGQMYRSAPARQHSKSGVMVELPSETGCTSRVTCPRYEAELAAKLRHEVGDVAASAVDQRR